MEKTAVAIGNFDGFHRGHQRIISQLVKIAKKRNLTPVVLTFSSHPAFWFDSSLLTTEEQKRELFKRYKVKICQLNFVSIYHSQPEEFVRKILVKKLNADCVVVGENFRFGYLRKGDISTLRELGEKYNFQVKIVPLLKKKGKIISSGYIRKLLREGNLEMANSLLGRAYEIQGKVIPGARRGKELGFPTANLEADSHVLLPQGVFIAKIQENNHEYQGVVNIGIRPTFAGNSIPRAEVHLLSLCKRLYRKKLNLSLLKKIRPEKKFPSPLILQKQIEKDVAYAKNFFLKKR